MFSTKDLLFFEELKKAISLSLDKGDDSLLKKFSLNDICRLWAYEDGVFIPQNFCVSDLNSIFFKKINTDKLVTSEMASTLGYNSIKCHQLDEDDAIAILQAKKLFNTYGKVVIRGRRNIFSGYGTFICSSLEEIEKALLALKELSANKDKIIEALLSPYHDAPVEYGAFMIGDEVFAVVVKVRNPKNGLHNLSQGADNYLITEGEKFEAIKAFCKGLNIHFGTAFMRVDIMDCLDEGLVLVELSVPNFKKFSTSSRKKYEQGKRLFMKYYEKFLK